MKILTYLLLLTFPVLGSSAAQEYWVTSDVADRKTCPATECGVLGQIHFRNKATVEEIKGQWARVTRYYDAYCEAGRSKYVKSGNAQCVGANGIKEGQVAEWIELRHLGKTRPADPAAGATGTAALIGGSDDFKTYREVFVKVADELLASKRCKAAELREMGGWVRSTSHTVTPTYFVYCGGMAPANKIYLDAKAGKIVKP